MDEVTLVVVLNSGRVMKMTCTNEAATKTVKFVSEIILNNKYCLCFKPSPEDPPNWAIRAADISAVFIEDDDTYLYREDEV